MGAEAGAARDRGCSGQCDLGGAILAPGQDPDAAAIRAVLDLMGSSADLDATAIQTVGTKGWDGFAIAVVR